MAYLNYTERTRLFGFGTAYLVDIHIFLRYILFHRYMGENHRTQRNYRLNKTRFHYIVKRNIHSDRKYGNQGNQHQWYKDIFLIVALRMWNIALYSQSSHKRNHPGNLPELELLF